MRHSERGNVLFYILIAIVLLAALSLAVSQSGRGNLGQLNAEKARLYATEIIEFTNTLTNAVAQLRLRGFKDGALCFDDAGWGVANYNHGGCSDNAAKIFHVDGGGLTWSRPPADAMDASASPDNLWHIYGDNEIEGVGTTCGAAGCSDLVVFVDELDLVVCQQINDLLALTGPQDPPPTDADMGETRFIGTYDYDQTIGDEAGGVLIEGKASACFQKTGAPAKYVFYKVLVAR